MILFFDRAVNKLQRLYRCKLFRAKTGNKAEGLKIRGQVFVMNKNVKVGKNVSLYPGVQFFGDGLIEIGNNVSIGNGTLIYASKDAGVKIDDNTSIAAQCYIIDTDHGMRRNDLIRNQKNSSKKIIIEDDVWLAANCTILRGSIIRKGAVIGAKSLVRGEIEPYGIAVGIPAKVIKHREVYVD